MKEFLRLRLSLEITLRRARRLLLILEPVGTLEDRFVNVLGYGALVGPGWQRIVDQVVQSIMGIWRRHEVHVHGDKVLIGTYVAQQHVPQEVVRVPTSGVLP